VDGWVELIEGIMSGDSGQRVIGLFFEIWEQLGQILLCDDLVNLCVRHGGPIDDRTEEKAGLKYVSEECERRLRRVGDPRSRF
jgi:hypothetical protein